TRCRMRRGPRGQPVSVSCEPDREYAMAAAILERSTTLGLRSSHVERVISGRRVMSVMTRWGQARVKVKEAAGRPIDVTAEHEDVRKLAHDAGADVRLVARSAEAAARKELGIE